MITENLNFFFPHSFSIMEIYSIRNKMINVDIYSKKIADYFFI